MRLLLEIVLRSFWNDGRSDGSRENKKRIAGSPENLDYKFVVWLARAFLDTMIHCISNRSRRLSGDLKKALARRCPRWI